MLKDVYFPSSGAGRIHVCVWEPAVKVRGVVQIVHGIGDYAARYSDFAAFLNEHGFLVVAEDHMGHGKSIGNGSIQGYFHGGWNAAVKDTYRLLKNTREQYPDVPYILFGHSMGSFMARSILIRYPDCGITGCVICGTAWQNEALLGTAIALTKLVCRIKGEKHPSKMLHNLMFGSYNKRIEHPRTANDWISRDKRVVDAYNADPLCGFIPAAGLCRDMLNGITVIQKQENLMKMKKDIPILFIAGGDDPVGEYGEGVIRTAQEFLKVGIENVLTKLYPLCRHEILNEINREEVYADVLNWIDAL